MKKKINQFILNENISFKNILNPIFMFKLFHKHRYLHFFIVGSTGVLIQLITTWFFIMFIFGQDKKFESYLIGLTLNLIYNFILYSLTTFKTKKNHITRFIFYLIYSFMLAFIQANIVKSLESILNPGVYLFLLIITFVILLFSTITFLVFKLWLFKEK